MSHPGGAAFDREATAEVAGVTLSAATRLLWAVVAHERIKPCNVRAAALFPLVRSPRGDPGLARAFLPAFPAGPLSARFRWQHAHGDRDGELRRVLRAERKLA